MRKYITREEINRSENMIKKATDKARNGDMSVDHVFHSLEAIKDFSDPECSRKMNDSDRGHLVAVLGQYLFDTLVKSITPTPDNEPVYNVDNDTVFKILALAGRRGELRTRIQAADLFYIMDCEVSQ
jgi:hypothetical protein